MYKVYKIGVGLFSNYPIVKIKTFNSKTDAENFATQLDRKNRKEYPKKIDRKFYSDYRFRVVKNKMELFTLCRQFKRECF